MPYLFSLQVVQIAATAAPHQLWQTCGKKLKPKKNTSENFNNNQMKCKEVKDANHT